MTASPRQLLLIGLLLMGIGLVEAGVRQAPARQQATLNDPAALAPALDRLRAAPLQAIGSPADAAIVEGVVFGRTNLTARPQRDLFKRTGLWHRTCMLGPSRALFPHVDC